MKLYRFSPIKNKEELLKAIQYLHFAACKLCKQTLGYYLPNAGNLGIFCHYDEEYEILTKIRKEITNESSNWNQKYFKLYQPIVIPAQDEISETTYTYLYVRKPDPYRSQVGDIDFYLEPEKHKELKDELLAGKKIKGARIFPGGEDMIELFNPNIDVLDYVHTHKME